MSQQQGVRQHHTAVVILLLLVDSQRSLPAFYVFMVPYWPVDVGFATAQYSIEVVQDQENREYHQNYYMI